MAISNFAFLEFPGILKNIFDPQLVKSADAKNCGYGGQAILLNMLYLSCYFEKTWTETRIFWNDQKVCICWPSQQLVFI